jgi:hypothetical protein
MFGLEILDVAIGLILVYLLLALFATALNEYVAAVLNLRGKELAKGLGQLLDDLDDKGAVRRAQDGVATRLNTATQSLTEQLYNHRLIKPFATRQGWITRVWWWLRNGKWSPLPLLLRGRTNEAPRLPSYIPARAFAQALLDVLGVDEKDANLRRLLTVAASETPAEAATAKVQSAAEALETAEAALRTATASNRAAEEGNVATARMALSKARLAHVLTILKNESSLDLTEHLTTLSGLAPATSPLATDLKVQVAGAMAGAQTQLQKLHDGVEVWFNNAMDRVSGAYKRTAQGWLFVLGLLIASCMNADTVDMWYRLAKDDQLRAAMVRRAEAMVASVDSTVADSALATATVRTTAPATDTAPTTPPAASVSPAVTLTSACPSADTTTCTTLKAVDQARKNYKTARTRLDSMELRLGWTTEQAVEARVLRRDTTGYPREGKWISPFITRTEQSLAPDGYHADLFPFDTRANWIKILGLLLTALAISLGAPFWFDLLNKVISIRTAGRSPAEKPKSPEGGPKRIAERAPK